MPDQIVITEKASRAKDVRTAVGSRYGFLHLGDVGLVVKRIGGGRCAQRISGVLKDGPSRQRHLPLAPLAV